MSGLTALWIAVVLLILNAYFVGAEFALVSARRSSIEPRALAGQRAARITLRAMENVSLMLAACQLGITVASLGLGSVAEPAFASFLEAPFEAIGLPEGLVHPVAFVIALAVVVFLHVVLGEMVPKNIAMAGPDRLALVLTPVLVLVVMVLRPIVGGLNLLANGTLRLLRIEPKDEVTSAYTRDEVAGLVAESRREGLLGEDEHELLTGALEFEERTAASVLLPVSDLVTLTPDSTPRDVEAAAAATGYSRFPVQAATGDLVGYVHLKDVLETDAERRGRPVGSRWLRPLTRVGVDEGLRSVLRTMQSSGSHLARVTDRDGAVLGVVALEDVLEELVGEIRDDASRGRGRRR